MRKAFSVVAVTIMVITVLCASASARQFVTASINAQNTWSSTIYPKGEFNISVSGTWAGTVSVQRSFDGGSTWVNVENFTANVEKQGNEPEEGVAWRIGVATGNYGSGTAVVRISQ